MEDSFSEWMQERIAHINPLLVEHFSAERFSLAPHMTEVTIYPLQTGGKRTCLICICRSTGCWSIRGATHVL